MIRSHGRRTPRRGRLPRPAGTRIRWSTTGDGDFHCPACGGDRRYLCREGLLRWTLLGVPLLPRGRTGPVIECAGCAGHFPPSALEALTATRLTAMLREAVRTLVLAVLAAGGTENACARAAAADALREAGHPDCTAFTAEADDALCRIELHEAMVPLAAHLTPEGRERLLLTGARVALADGLYRAAERDVLAAAGAVLRLGTETTHRLLAEAARTPS